jgi:hypothetical protein
VRWRLSAIPPNRDTRTGRARPEQLQSLLRTTLRGPGPAGRFQVPGTDRYLDADGVRVEPLGAVPVELGGREIGVIRPGSGTVRPELLRQIAGWSATLVEVVRLRLELARALHEVESSRARLVQAGYQERRRLERDPHDGAAARVSGVPDRAVTAAGAQQDVDRPGRRGTCHRRSNPAVHATRRAQRDVVGVGRFARRCGELELTGHLTVLRPSADRQTTRDCLN